MHVKYLCLTSTHQWTVRIMSARTPSDIVNFAAGPAKLPHDVVLEASAGAVNYNGTGIGAMEISHRSKDFAKINNEAIDCVKRLLNVPDNYKILLLQGGGTGQFASIPLNLTRSKDEVVDYFVTGNWSAKAAKEAEKYATVNLVLPKTVPQYTDIPDQSQWKLSANASYAYYCDNETAFGVEFPYVPDTGSVPLVVDMSSNFLTRPVDVSKFALIYAGAQKNVGCAGVTVVIVRDDFIGKARVECPAILDYKITRDNNSLYNTPCTWAVYILGLVLKWLERNGGVPEMQQRSARKSKMILDIVSKSNGFYSFTVKEAFRSRVNVPFHVGGGEKGDEAVEAEFLKKAEEKGLLQLKGYRLVGGIRASLYNAVTVEEVGRLAQFMTDFLAAHKK